MDCLFCKIVAKEVDGQIVYESDAAVGFKDINPAAPTHVLVVPKKHVGSIHELGASDGDLLGALFEATAAVATDAGIEDGYRVVTNVGGPAGQSVFHLHLHVLGGRSMSWPPG